MIQMGGGTYTSFFYVLTFFFFFWGCGVGGVGFCLFSLPPPPHASRCKTASYKTPYPFVETQRCAAFRIRRRRLSVRLARFTNRSI